MLKHENILSSEVIPEDKLILVKPDKLDTGEVQENGIVIEMSQNTSVVDRPTTGIVVKVGKDIDTKYLNQRILWVRQDGIDALFKDGEFLFLEQKSILGIVKDR